MTAEPSEFETRVANLVAEAVPDIVHVAMRDRPDADLTHANGNHIGVEIVRTTDQLVAFGEGRMVEAHKLLESTLRDAGVTGSHTVSFDLLAINDGKGREFQKWLNSTAKALVEVLREPNGRVLVQTELEQLGVTRIASIESTPSASLSLRRGYLQRHRQGQSVAEQRLRDKDKLLKNYRELNGQTFVEYWLAIASIGPGTVEDGGYSMLMDRTFHTTYDRVFLIFRGQPPRAVDITPPSKRTHSEQP